MPENAGHAPGHEITGEGGAVRQRHRMAEGGGPMGGGGFGVGPIPGTHMLQNHGAHMPHDGVHLADEHRSGPPAIAVGDGMHATAHSHHGPHNHNPRHHSAPNHTRPHHVDGHNGERTKGH